jgi:hypothetical protein
MLISLPSLFAKNTAGSGIARTSNFSSHTLMLYFSKKITKQY